MLRLLQICSCLNSFRGPFWRFREWSGNETTCSCTVIGYKKLWTMNTSICQTLKGIRLELKTESTNVSQVDGLTWSPYHHILCNLTQKLQVWKYPMYRVMLYISATLGVWWKWPSDVGGGATPGWFSGWWSRSGAGRGADTPPGRECSPTEITTRYVTIH